ncbi:hypothetical protein HN51_032887 [Arachis hypogaea]|uniref:EF-hand domain-containing protein n=1 Tax=Arachis hypogaea TaxID=3818 RepID=A0A445B2W0_ARAHY|nr:UDP-glycosyltransferase 83A1-like [Arachis hypogaea]QHO17279.1 UDP-glycosyltransferase [Arachis hypogaea]RYR32999.1 hypothetical protein Ahy_A10g047526 [Arachis hypogaea]
MSVPTVLVLPLPAQGHVNPMMIFSQRLAENGCNIIFVNTEFIHKKVLSSMGNQEGGGVNGEWRIKLVSMPDGLGPDADRNNIRELFDSILNNMPAMLERVIEDLRLKDGVTVSCIVADFVMAWALEIARKIGIRGVLFNPASAAMLALQCSIPKLIEDGIIDSNGLATTQKRFQLSPSIPPMDTESIWWGKISDSKTEKMLFNIILESMKTLESTEWCLCNSTPDLEPGALSFVPKLLPIGPLLRTYGHDQGVSERSLGQFWEEDFSCLNWLDQQPHGSVIYVAFGSTTLFDEKQFKELALGLELTNRPFLWVLRKDSDCNNKVCFPNEFKGTQGKIIEWAPQEKVLSHPAIACFISHCGWNSTLEGVSNGVPFLCWPYYADQFFDKIYICDEWKVGLGFDLDENGMISREEIKVKVDKLLSDENIKFKAREIKKKLMKDVDVGGRSSENLNKFINWLKE